jgi:hypothetical protein
MDLAAQADHSGSTRHLDQKALNPGHPAEAPKRRHGVDFLEKRVHPKPFSRAATALNTTHIAAKDLNGGKLNQANQGDDPFGSNCFLSPSSQVLSAL